MPQLWSSDASGEVEFSLLLKASGDQETQGCMSSTGEKYHSTDHCNRRTDGQKREFWQASLRLQNMSRARRQAGKVGMKGEDLFPLKKNVRTQAVQLHALD